MSWTGAGKRQPGPREVEKRKYVVRDALGREMTSDASRRASGGVGARQADPGAGRGHFGAKMADSVGESGPKSADPAGNGQDPAGLVNGDISSRFCPTDGQKDFRELLQNQAPVVGFRMLKNDVVLVRSARNPEELAERLAGCERGEVESLSMKSRRRLALIAGNTSVVFKSFVTLTYPKEFPADGKLVKRHLHAIKEALNRKCGKPSYLWFLEFQKRGAPHFHIFLSFGLPAPLAEMKRTDGRRAKTVRTSWRFQDWLCKRWFKIVGSGDEKHLRAGAAWEVIEKPDGAARYVAKESYKTFQKVVPEDFRNVGRFWGCSRDVPPPEPEMVPCSLAEMRKVFPREFFDKDGFPYPVLFGAAGEYAKIAGTSADPVKIRAWRKVRKNSNGKLDI